MSRAAQVVCVLAALAAAALAVKVKLVVRSEEDSRAEDDARWERRDDAPPPPAYSRRDDAPPPPTYSRRDDAPPAYAPRDDAAPPPPPTYARRSRNHPQGARAHANDKPNSRALAPAPPSSPDDKLQEYEEVGAGTERAPPSPAHPAHSAHPTELLFPLVYRQSRVTSMFKWGERWYTWASERRADGSRATAYYLCRDEPKRCDEIGWEPTDSVPRCAFQIESLLEGDRACVNPFGVEPHASAGAGAGACDAADQMKVSEIVRSCGPRLRSLWRFSRSGRRAPPAPSVARPADVNALLCDDEDECYVSIEYRIHHDRITFSVHEPSRGQTFKSALKREAAAEEGAKPTERPRSAHRGHDEPPAPPRHKPRLKARVRTAEGKGVLKERERDRDRDDSAYNGRRSVSNKIKLREDVSDDISE